MSLHNREAISTWKHLRFDTFNLEVSDQQVLLRDFKTLESRELYSRQQENCNPLVAQKIKEKKI